MRVDGLRCEYLIDPLGIDVRQPRLSWRLRSERRGARQTSYRVVVSSAPGGDGDLWDTGWQHSERNTHLAYDGAPLESRQRCSWLVHVRDERGTETTSEPARWEMGLLRPDDWQADWIGRPWPLDFEPEARPAPHLRTSFDATGPVRRARLYITALGLYRAWVNGDRAGRDVLTPGWTDYHQRVRYQTYDVTRLVRRGANALAVVLAEGWYAGHVGFDGERAHWGQLPQLRAQLEVTYEDGSTHLVATDETWRAGFGPVGFADLLKGERYDARLEIPGWTQPGFDDTGWGRAMLTVGTRGRLVAQSSEPIRVVQEMPTREVTEPEPGTYVVDIGQNIAGWARLRVRGEAGTQVQLRFAEALNPDGTIYTANLRGADATDRYVLRGGDEEVWEPSFTFHGFRYVEVTGYPGRPGHDAVTGIVATSDVRETGNFECSDEMVNRLYANVVWSRRGTFLDLPIDCPQRDERLGWLGDTVFVRTACFLADVAAFSTKWLTDVADAFDPRRGYSDVAPFVHSGMLNLAEGAPGWGDAGVVYPWTLYRHYGDERVLAEHFPIMRRWVEIVAERNPDLVWRHRRGNDYGDWLSVDADTPKEVLATAYFAHSADLVSRAAGVLGRRGDARRYAALHRRIARAFRAAFVSRDGRVHGHTQTGYLLALRYGLLTEAQRPKALGHLVADVEQRGHLTTGFHGTGHLLPALTEAGREDLAYRLLLSEGFPSWGFAVRHGATTMWERWDSWHPERGFANPFMNSFNHYCLGSVAEWLFTTVGGIDMHPDAVGFRRALVRPRPGGGFDWARASCDTMHGQVSCSWSVDGDSLEMQVVVPPGCSAEVHVPATGEVTEGGGAAEDADGLTFLRRTPTSRVYDATSGRYAFRSSSWFSVGPNREDGSRDTYE